jgi:RHS repeat-associated protein
MVSSTLPDGSVETKSYTAAADLASIVSVKSGTTITSSAYSYDSLGRKTSETTPSYAVAYTYDNGGQLTGENRTGVAAYSASYTYDAAGNRASKMLGGTTEYYSYDNANKLLTAGGKSYSYDNAGNTTDVSWSGGSTSLTWDGAGRLKSSTSSGSTVNYAYNGIGQRVQKTGGASASYILTDDSIDSEVLSDGAASFVRGASGLVSENRGGTSKFYHADALGSVKALTNASGAVTDAKSTDAFGLVVTSSGSTPTPFGFAGNHGYQQDSETGLMRLGHRMYDASTGRFISRDPIRAGHNWYAYCDNDPVQKVDAEGLDFTWQPGVKFVGFTPSEEKKIKDFLREPYLPGNKGKFPKREQLLDDLREVGKTKPIKIVSSPEPPQAINAPWEGQDIFINPKFPKKVRVKDKDGNIGFEPFDIPRQLAHELGHITGIIDDYDPRRHIDDGGNGMQMIRLTENPVMVEGGRGERLDYGYY